MQGPESLRRGRSERGRTCLSSTDSSRKCGDALRAQALQRENVLRAIRIKHLRGIRNLGVPFSHPVSVLAGPNGCGKSTVLFACACAYRDPDRGPREFVPTSLFPNFVDPRQGRISDRNRAHRTRIRLCAWRRGLRHGLEARQVVEPQFYGTQGGTAAREGRLPADAGESNQSIRSPRCPATGAEAVSDRRADRGPPGSSSTHPAAPVPEPVRHQCESPQPPLR